MKQTLIRHRAYFRLVSAYANKLDNPLPSAYRLYRGGPDSEHGYTCRCVSPRLPVFYLLGGRLSCVPHAPVHVSARETSGLRPSVGDTLIANDCHNSLNLDTLERENTGEKSRDAEIGSRMTALCARNRHCLASTGTIKCLASQSGRQTAGVRRCVRPTSGSGERTVSLSHLWRYSE